ncbi:rhodanese-like domain-containing protein [Galbibacter pacificus]|uniref:Rhodanese-like domain-containing protein n=1 Tax=Galbibacter pacificus TaxID=2996052 RepID=A0ABT6FM37_9FLAO|nr:rhodanese-like domain-containing protein [Galbibacter pacificus]MDG3580845.1 rhodanese-like domain-containing protein [Galbibacter pacificus]MDG3584323.1 rhodanese-like domain-containing protein [Galbibacter pacificus]
MNKSIFIVFLLMATQFTFSQVQDEDITEFKNELSENDMLLDVRTPKEYQEGYIKDAININVKSDDFVEKVSRLDKNANIYLYCKAGGRSAKASEKLAALGFKNIHNLDGGFDAWVNAGKQFVKE